MSLYATTLPTTFPYAIVGPEDLINKLVRFLMTPEYSSFAITTDLRPSTFNDERLLTLWMSKASRDRILASDNFKMIHETLLRSKINI